MPQTKALFLFCCLTAGMAHAQSWEVGAIGGYGFARDLTLNGPAGSAKAGLKDGPVAGGFVADEMYQHFSGEFRYLYRASDLKLASGATIASFDGRTHIVHVDWLSHFQPRESRARVFVAVGGGIKVLQGTGVESAAQPLGRFAGLTHAQQVLPVGDIGAGVKVNLSKHVRVRIEARDYISTRPDQVIVPAPGVTFGGIWNDLLALASIGYTW